MGEQSAHASLAGAHRRIHWLDSWEHADLLLRSTHRGRVPSRKGLAGVCGNGAGSQSDMSFARRRRCFVSAQIGVLAVARDCELGRLAGALLPVVSAARSHVDIRCVRSFTRRRVGTATTCSVWAPIGRSCCGQFVTGRRSRSPTSHSRRSHRCV